VNTSTNINTIKTNTCLNFHLAYKYKRPSQHTIIFISSAGAVAKYSDGYVCVCVCLSVRISPEPYAWSLNIFVHVTMAVARSSGVLAIRYVLPVLWMTSCFFL